MEITEQTDEDLLFTIIVGIIHEQLVARITPTDSENPEKVALLLNKLCYVIASEITKEIFSLGNWTGNSEALNDLRQQLAKSSQTAQN